MASIRGLGLTPVNVKETSLCQPEAGSWSELCIKQENSRGCLTCDMRTRSFWPSVQGSLTRVLASGGVPLTKCHSA